MSNRDANTDRWAARAFAMVMIIAERGDELTPERRKEFLNGLLNKAPDEVVANGAISLLSVIAETNK